jgi:hypothetical protein
MKNGFNDRFYNDKCENRNKGNEVIEVQNIIFYCAVISIKRKGEDKKLEDLEDLEENEMKKNSIWVL